jgi:hypothetical protein
MHSTVRRSQSWSSVRTIGRFIGFMIGIWSTRLFTYHMYEKRNIHNLFGLLERKKVVMHSAPLWFEWIFAVLIGFIAMELFYFLFQELNNRLFLWRRSLRLLVLLKWKIKKARK